MRRMHKSDMCGVNKSLPYIAMVPLGCPQPTLSGMVPLCRCAQLFRPMFSRKSGVVKCISRNAVDAANILWLISGKRENLRNLRNRDKRRLFMFIVFQFDPSSILRVIYEYSVMSEVTRAYPLLVWGVTLGLLPSCKVGGTHQPGRAGMQ